MAQRSQMQQPSIIEINNNNNNNLKALRGEQRFELRQHLADTLQGRIYIAIDKTNGASVVVKETWKQLIKLQKSREGHRVPENFIQEKKILYYLSSQDDCNPGFARILDEWEDQNCYFYAMENCRDGELFEYIKTSHTKDSLAKYTMEQQQLPQEPLKEPNEWIKTVRHIFRQLVDCVSWMHKKNVCHLDLSLENAMIYDVGKKHVKIIDFGLALYSANGNFINNKRVGKTGYMAPEVFAKKFYDGRKADIWSLGVMLFMMLIGAPPYELPTPNNPAFHYIINGQLRSVLLHWRRLRHITEDALDLLTKIFKVENERISMENLLKHPFVQLDSNPLRQVPPKIQLDIKESIDDKVEEVIDEIITNDFDNNHSTTTANTSTNPGGITRSTSVGSSTTVTSDDIVAQSHGVNNNQNVQNNNHVLTNYDSPTTISTIEDSKNDDTMTQTNPTGDVEVGDNSDIINRQFKTNEANSFRKKILEFGNQTNNDAWRSFTDQLATIINHKKNERKNQLANQGNPGGDGEYPPEGISDEPDEDELKLNLEIEELQWLHVYISAKAN